MASTAPTTSMTTDPVAKPWYLSSTILGILAAVIMSAATRFGLLAKLQSWGIIPADFDEQQLIGFLLVAIPALVAAYGRFKATHRITLTSSAAAAINLAAAQGQASRIDQGLATAARVATTGAVEAATTTLQDKLAQIASISESAHRISVPPARDPTADDSDPLRPKR